MSDFITVAELRFEAERLCDENEHLQAENVRLRSYLSDDVENARMIMCENSRLREQNAKLRELVHWMYDCMDESCAVQYPYAPMPINYDQLMQAQARACNLGVVVDV